MTNYVPPEEEHFVEQFEKIFIDKVEHVEPVLEDLLRDRLLVSEQYRAVTTQRTNQEKMRELFKAVKKWSHAQKDKLLQTLKTTNPKTVEDIEQLSYDEVTAELSYYRKELQEVVKHHFEFMKDRNSLLGEYSLLRKRYMPLVMLRKFRGEEEKRQELSASGEELEKILQDRLATCLHVTPLTLFDPGEDGVVPKTVVLQGPSGIGKSMTAHMVSLEWADGNFYPDKFLCLFYLSYMDYVELKQNMSFAAFLTRVCHWNCPPGTMRRVLNRSENVLFLLNGFESMKWSEGEVQLCDDPFKVVPKEVLLRSLLKRRFAKDASFLITTRPYRLERLRSFLVDLPRFVDILGYTVESRLRYVRVYITKPARTDKGVEFVKNNPVLLTMCHVPFMCWVVSTVTLLEVAKYPLKYKGDSSMFLYYLKGILKYHNRDQPEGSSMKRLCSLAKEGVMTGKVLFQKEDLKRHGVTMTPTESCFLSENSFHGDIGKRTLYSFVHRSFQEYLAAAYYAVCEPGSGANKIPPSLLPEMCKGRSLLELLQKNPHLALCVRFSFGLSNQQLNKDFAKSAATQLSFQASAAMGEWLLGEELCEMGTEVLGYLHETQDEDFARRLVAPLPEVRVSQSQEHDSWISHLVFCLKACEGKKVTLCGYTLAGYEMCTLAPLLHRCPQVCFRSCRFVEDGYVPPEEPRSGSSADYWGDRGSSRDYDRGYSRDYDRGSSWDSDRGYSRASDLVYLMSMERDHPRNPDRPFPRMPDWAYSRAAERAYRKSRDQGDWHSGAADNNRQGALFQWLLKRNSDIRELCLWGCHLPAHTCGLLSTAVDLNDSLTSLDVMFKVEKKEEREEMLRYLQSFRGHSYNTSTRKILGKSCFMFQIKRKRMKRRLQMFHSGFSDFM